MVVVIYYGLAHISIENDKMLFTFQGQPLLLFKRILLGRSQTLPLLICNEGTLPSKVDIDCADPDNAFTLVPTGNTQAVMATADAGV